VRFHKKEKINKNNNNNKIRVQSLGNEEWTVNRIPFPREKSSNFNVSVSISTGGFCLPRRLIWQQGSYLEQCTMQS
jgi:hypothetical protein